jgi:mRNA interferase MazF
MADPGTVVLVDFTGVAQTKRRPAVVMSSVLYHSSRPDVILGLLTTDVAGSTAPTDYVLQDWSAAGLHRPTAFRAFLLTQPATFILRELGRLSDRDWQEVKQRLRLALEVS